MMDKELEITLKRAVDLAQSRYHEFVTIEHLLAALTDDADAKSTIEACGGNVESIKTRIYEYLDNELDDIRVANHEYTKPTPTQNFHRVLQRAAIHVQSSGKDTPLTGANVLVALFAEKDSFAAYYLEQEGISRFDAVNWLAHGVRKGEAKKAEPVMSGEGRETNRRKERSKALEEFAVNLNEKAKKGGIDPLIGREKEVHRTIQVLCRRSKNNPLYVGDPGVGKTAIAEGLAKRIVEDKVPEALKNVTIYALDMAAVVAGTRYRGDFEERLKAIINDLKKDPNAIIFIDEIHTLVGAGSGAGSLDASNILKPALSSGEIRCIGSTTYKEFRQHFEKDQAITRRFQKIDVSEPTVSETIEIVKGLRPYFEKHHHVTYTDEVIETAVKLANRFVHDRKMPDKAIDIIDEAGASLRADDRNEKGVAISVNDIERVVAQIARIPEKNINKDDRSFLKTIERDLGTVVFGQEDAVKIVSNAVKMAKAGLRNSEKPIGSYLFTGPTGVGKTELARQLSKLLGIELHRFDMSEYMEKHAVARLIGAPPGYVGFEQGGLLTDAVDKTPHCIVLLDEIEKAHPDLFNILLQVMDYGKLTDNNGKKVDFRNVVLIMTSNVGASEMAKPAIGFGRSARVDEDKEAVKRLFTPEFRNRLDAIVPFKGLQKEAIHLVVDKFISQLEAQLQERGVFFELEDDARAWLGEKGYDPAMGARPLERVIRENINQPLADEILFGALEHGGVVRVHVKDDKIAFEFKPVASDAAPEAIEEGSKS